MPKHCIFVEILLIEGYVQGALRKDLFSAPFLEDLQTATLGKSTNKFCQYLEQFTKTSHFCRIFADERLCTGCSTKGAVRCSFHRAL